MEKDSKILELKKRIQKSINDLEKNRIHVLYFSYYLNFHNIYHNPLLLTGKVLNFFLKRPSIDHVCHISRFIFDEEFESWQVKVFEATMERGMEQNDLFDKLKSFQGICYIETLDIVDKKKAKEFEKDYFGVPYSKELAALSGLDIKALDKVTSPKNNGGFCSWLMSLFLIDQGYDLNQIQKGNPFEITPSDLFVANLGKKTTLFKN